MRNESGFILLTILVFSQIFMLFSITILSNHAVLIKNCFVSVLKQERLIIAHRVLENVERVIPHCVVDYVVDNLSSKPLVWWQRHACFDELSGQQYYYLIELLDKNTCVRLKNNENILANYYRVTIYLLDQTNQIKVMLQSKVIQNSYVAVNLCKNSSQLVVLGRQMWSEI